MSFHRPSMQHHHVSLQQIYMKFRPLKNKLDPLYLHRHHRVFAINRAERQAFHLHASQTFPMTNVASSITRQRSAFTNDPIKEGEDGTEGEISCRVSIIVS